ncbi:endonuclease/exonuclease/phosphatase family protein [Streptomyces sp. H27-D2]|uniref:endonuclease/exonuclease/phosphatase family protein n=1 Tax=Streptomyces sp. H27-D2 TaxID=3046304 RepID=UPI002DBC7108|nr:endonuclease/exonuclease/phosphatase family protein [Streptomyces sp. H27-D2]MEC4018901.1 endonuclease/exonuclease/phosphatase family protein [Streptomyces sp. H27-D2]
MPLRRHRFAQLLLAAGILALAAAPPGPASAADSSAPDERHGPDTPNGGKGRYLPLRVASYNIAAGAGADHVFDPTRTAEALRALDADVIGLQEVDVHWGARSAWRDLAADLAEQLGMRVYFAPIYSLDPLEAGQPRREFGVAVLSRFPILSAENHDITRLSTQDPNPAPAPAPGFGEVVLRVHGTRVHVYATHLDYRADPSVRRAQVADTRRIMAEDCDRHGRCPRQVLVGDFNAEPGAAELTPLWERLTDAVPSGSGLTYPARTPVKRIDYVTVSDGIRVRGATVPETLASDHRPVVADLLVRRGGRR